MTLEFRKAGTADVPVLNSLSQKAFDTDVEVGGTSAGGPPGYMSVPFHMEMARTGHLYKLTENGLMIGGAILFQNGDELNVGRIFVNPEHFRKGYGIRMMEAIEALFTDVKIFTLDTPAWNIRTNAFYAKLGYTEVRRDGDCIYYAKRR